MVSLFIRIFKIIFETSGRGCKGIDQKFENKCDVMFCAIFANTANELALVCQAIGRCVGPIPGQELDSISTHTPNFFNRPVRDKAALSAGIGLLKPVVFQSN